MLAECISEGNVLVTGVESLPSLGLAVAAGMMAVIVENGWRFVNKMMCDTQV